MRLGRELGSFEKSESGLHRPMQSIAVFKSQNFYQIYSSYHRSGPGVQTNHGTGTIVMVDGEKYLVALDGQVAQLWEKEWGMRNA